MHVIEQPLPSARDPVAEPQIVAEWTALYNDHTKIACLMLGTRVEKFDLIQSFHACKQEEGKPVADYVLKMKGYVEKLERLGYVLPQDISVGLILNGLTKDFVGFVRNYNMHNMGKTIGEIHAMLIEYEKGLPKKAETPQVMMIKSGKIQKANKKSLNAKGKNKVKGKGKDKKDYIPKPKTLSLQLWSAQLRMMLATTKKRKQVSSVSSSGIFTIELFSFPNNNSWVYDTGCGTNICITKQGFRIERKLKQGALYLYVGNGVRAQVEAIGSFDLVLPNGLVICLDNCHYAPTITRGVVSVSRLVDNGFVQCFTDYGISVSKNGVLYFNVVSRNGIYEIDMHDLVPNVNSIYNVSNKRVKHNLDSTYLWHCRLAHINKKRIKQLQQDGLLKSTDDESFDKCESCLSGKMTKKPFLHSNERAKDLLGINTHTDVCVKLRTCVKFKVLATSLHSLDDYSRYPKETMGYYFYFPPENKIVVARYAEFFEKNLITQEVSGRAIDLEEIQDEDTSPSEITSEIPMEVEGFEPPQEEEIPIRRSERTRRAPNRLCLNVEAEEHSLGDLNEPTSYKAAMLDSESNKWIDAMNAEIQSMMDNMVWVLVDLPPGCKTVGSKWIFKKKTDMDGIVHTYKARLVAKGYTQLYGVDYEETFSPVADIRAIRILISIAAYYDYEIWKMDIKTAFLNGYLDEDIYMVQPEGFVDPNHPRKVCKLQRSIYGLKQASRSWNKRFDEEIKRFGFAQNLDEPCVYQKASGSNVTFLILYVDDIIIMGNHIPSLQSVKDYLGKCFAMKDLGEATFILGIKIYRDRSKRLIGLSQNAYMDKILKRYRMDNSKRGHIPMQERLDLNKSQGAQTPIEVNHMKNVPYASAVGSIMYAVRCTRPDVAFAQNMTSRFQQNPAVWIRKFISGLGIVPTINEPLNMYCDNSAAVHYANEPGIQRGAIHYHRRYHYVRECVELGEIRILKVHIDNNLGDPFTKALSNRKLTQHARGMRLRSASSFM
ncbi:retrotransposon protein, putative, ty1-copia subclass [Tanacetum coccineum]